MRPVSATYRLQLHSGFTFSDAGAILDYLHRLGISDVYASPIFQAVKGSAHGYDVTDPNRLNPELGGQDAFAALMREKQRLGLGWLQDIVPNHTAFSPENTMLMDVLEKREQSAYYTFFDIDWDDPDPALNGKVLIPVLGAPLEEILDSGEITLARHAGRPMVCYYDNRFPLNAPSAQPFAEMSDSELAKVSQGPEGKATIKALLDGQYYVPAHWKTANETINYRRFFYINDLISMRVEDQAVMDATHRLIIEQVRQGHFTGLRIDHIDGLCDPRRYLQRLRQACPETYIVAEKILEHDEPLSEDWPIAGTTGYDFGAQVNALFCDRHNRAAFLSGYQAFIGQRLDYERLLYDKKQLILKTYMAADLRRLTRRLCGLLDRDDDRQLAAALGAIIAAFPVYRTYFDGRGFRTYDRWCIRQAVQTAVRFEPAQAEQIKTITELLPLSGDRSGPLDAETATFVRRLEQLTGPVMAKGFEDTLLYVYYPLAALNEVGGAPHLFGQSAEGFVAYLQQRRARWPHAMNATATHDSKRGEDVRARLNVLSEMPEVWFEKVSQWSRINEPYKTEHNGALLPDRNDEYLIYQTLLGAMPFEQTFANTFLDRVKAYMLKAIRESKRHTTWVEPNEVYEQATTAFIDRITGEDNMAFGDAFWPFFRQISEYGIVNSLAQTLVKMTAPGVCDVYQGSELWELSLVDPDNRRPVDYDVRAATLEALIGGSEANREMFLGDLIASRAQGGIKLFLIYTLLQQRKKHPQLFAGGDIEPLTIRGKGRGHLLAFARRVEDTCAITVVPRFVTALTEAGTFPTGKAVWGDTRIDLPPNLPARWHNVLADTLLIADKGLEVSQVLKTFPVAFLM